MGKVQPKKKSKRILYKVVNSLTRRSVVAGTMIQQELAYDKSEYTKCLKDVKKYLLTYEKNKVVKAHKKSFGCFLFKRKKDAENFADGFTRTRILRCEPLSKCKTPRIMCISVESKRLDTFYKFHRKIWNEQYERIVSSHVPFGTVCCHKVRVLD